MSNPQWLGEGKKVPCSQYDEKRGDPAQLESSTPSAKSERDGSEVPGRQEECLPIPKPVRGAVAPRCFFSSRTCHGGEIIPQLPSLQNLHWPSSTGVATSNNSAAQQAASSEPSIECSVRRRRTVGLELSQAEPELLGSLGPIVFYPTDPRRKFRGSVRAPSERGQVRCCPTGENFLGHTNPAERASPCQPLECLPLDTANTTCLYRLLL